MDSLPQDVVTQVREKKYLIQVSELTPVEGRADDRETVVYEQRVEGLKLSDLIVWINHG